MLSNGSSARAISPSRVEKRRTVWPSDSRGGIRWRPTNPEAPVTRISAIREEFRAPALIVVNGLHVIVHAPDIQPVAVVVLDVNRLFAGQQIQHQVVEAIPLVRRDDIQSRPIEYVNPHADHEVERRLLAKTRETV